MVTCDQCRHFKGHRMHCKDDITVAYNGIEIICVGYEPYEMKILTVFDFDDTLFRPDKERDILTRYMNPEHKVIPEMWSIFKHSEHKIILTARHPDLREYIQKLTDGAIVLCRDFCLTDEEINKVMNSKEEHKKFMEQLIKWKINVLNGLADYYDVIIFYENLKHLYDETDLKDNIEIVLPLHLRR